MKYFVDYQYMPKGAKRPIDAGETMPIEISSNGAPALLPAVGDFVGIQQLDKSADQAEFSGRVRSRTFTYFNFPQNPTCVVHIVVEETDQDWGELMKE